MSRAQGIRGIGAMQTESPGFQQAQRLYLRKLSGKLLRDLGKQWLSCQVVYPDGKPLRIVLTALGHRR